MNKKDIYKKKNGNYYNHIRHDLIQMIEGNDNKILDIGCGEGQTGWTLKKLGKAKEVIGIELVEGTAKRAEPRLDKVIHGDVEEEITLSFQPEGDQTVVQISFQGRFFDCEYSKHWTLERS